MSEGYSSQATERCERALGTLMRGIGEPWRHRVCLVGGLVPLYLIHARDYARPAHIGSTDVDVALRLVVDAEDEGAYATLERNLKRTGFSRVDGASWRWAADVDGEVVVLELLGESDDAEPGTIFRPKVEPPAGGGGVGLLCVRGVELAFADSLTIARDLQLLDGARSNVEFQVANLAPFVALKADAYLDRRKAKDAYDLVCVLRWWDGGPDAAAARVAASPVAREPFVGSALTRVMGDFAGPDRAGAADYARLAAPGGSAVETARARNEAVLVLRSSPRLCGLPRGRDDPADRQPPLRPYRGERGEHGRGRARAGGRSGDRLTSPKRPWNASSSRYCGPRLTSTCLLRANPSSSRTCAPNSRRSTASPSRIWSGRASSCTRSRAPTRARPRRRCASTTAGGLSARGASCGRSVTEGVHRALRRHPAAAELLTSFDDFAGNELFSERQGQDYRSLYLDLWAAFRRVGEAERESINDDLVFEIELIKQVEINVDYILMPQPA